MQQESPEVERLVADILTRKTPENWQSSGLTRDFYLDIVERIVRNAAPWVADDGAVIDPVLKREYAQSSSRFASSCAVLIYFGRCTEFREKLFRVMDHCCEGLRQPDSVERSPNFWMRELATAWHCLKNVAPAERLERWRRDLAQVVPEKNYKFVSSDPSERAKFHNWVVYSSAGESMRDCFGISGPSGALWGKRFFDEYVRSQFWRFNEHGMYRDPGDPITYDITTRLQLETALFFGYDGVLRERLRPLLDRAMAATLLFSAPTGQVPFGGRSSQFYFQEGIVSALCELAARRMKEVDARLAGAYKRQAHLSALAVRPGMLRSDGKLFHIKNQFPVGTLHGCDAYGMYSSYSLFAGSVFALAALFADDSIAEAPAPSELGGYGFALQNSFHKAFVNASGNFLEFDLLPPGPGYDACGLGRILLRDMPWGLLPVLPFAKKQNYRVAPGLAENTAAAAVAPEWFDRNGTLHRLAENAEVSGVFQMIAPGICHVRYPLPEAEVTYAADLNRPGELSLSVTLSGDVRRAEMVVPVLLDDGENKPELILTERGFRLVSGGKTLQVESDGASVRRDGTAVNRTGVYQLVKLAVKDNRIRLRFRWENGMNGTGGI